MRWREVAEEIGDALNRRPVVAAPSGTVSDALPAPLRALYAECDGADLPIGAFYPQRTALERSGVAPFHPGWVVFGDDGRGTFWLCAREPQDGRWLTAWDHEAGAEIDGAVWPDPGDLLRAVLTDTLAMRRGATLVIDDVPPAARMAVVRELGPFVSSGAAGRLRLLDTLPAEVPADDARAAYDALPRLRTAGARCHLRIDWL
jgi:hypothetical protein